MMAKLPSVSSRKVVKAFGWIVDRQGIEPTSIMVKDDHVATLSVPDHRQRLAKGTAPQSSSGRPV